MRIRSSHRILIFAVLHHAADPPAFRHSLAAGDRQRQFMKHRIFHSYAARFAFLTGAVIAAGLIILVQSILAIRRTSN
jgi:hypothetical protein